MELAGHRIGPQEPLFFIAGPCVIESEQLALKTAETLREIARRLGILIIYKSSFDKANRSSGASYRGLGMDEGLRILQKVRQETGMPVLTDVHSPEQVRATAEIVDVLQTPALLARQTDLIEAAAASGKPVNIKKGQFMAPADMRQVVAKAHAAAENAGVSTNAVMLTERGTSFGYHNLVVDMRGLSIMAETGRPIIFDATHSAQLPGGLGDRSGGERHHVPVLARAATAAGVSGIFMETHPDPDKALSDGPNSWPLDRAEALMAQLVALHELKNAGPALS